MHPESDLLEGSCHCGAVTIELPSPPDKATSCNCSLCRRVGGIWAYYEFGTVRVTGHPQHTQEYIQGDRTMRTVRCATCGCVTHWEPLSPEAGARHGVNLRNFDPRLLETVKVRRFDGADTWQFLDESPAVQEQNVPPPFAVQRIDHLVFRVRDLAMSIAFYEAVLGCHVVKRRDDLGLVHLRAGASMIDLISVDGPLGRKGGPPAGAQARNVDHLCLRVEPFDEASLVLHLARHAITPLGPASGNFGAEGNGLSLYFQDPDGNVVELKGPADGA